jgi:hypothetical protein
MRLVYTSHDGTRELIDVARLNIVDGKLVLGLTPKYDGVKVLKYLPNNQVLTNRGNKMHRQELIVLDGKLKFENGFIYGRELKDITVEQYLN